MSVLLSRKQSRTSDVDQQFFRLSGLSARKGIFLLLAFTCAFEDPSLHMLFFVVAIVGPRCFGRVGGWVVSGRFPKSPRVW